MIGSRVLRLATIHGRLVKKRTARNADFQPDSFHWDVSAGRSIFQAGLVTRGR